MTYEEFEEFKRKQRKQRDHDGFTMLLTIAWRGGLILGALLLVIH